jgi:predicted membrane channel-forming protein YqfA (hemolysin III family)
MLENRRGIVCALSHRASGRSSGIIGYVGCRLARDPNPVDAKEMLVNRIVYIVGAIVIIVALLSFFGLR